MKIIAGKFKGRNLDYRERRGLRVTSQKVKEAIFSMIGKYVSEACVLDLFCGYGTLGLEAISRGAKHVTFVDVDSQALKQLQFFLEKLDVVSQSALFKRDVIKVIKHLEPESFDLILMDPPYQVRCEEKTLEMIDRAGILRKTGLIVVEHSSDNLLKDSMGSFSKRREKIYGDTCVSIYARKGETPTVGDADQVQTASPEAAPDGSETPPAPAGEAPAEGDAPKTE